MPRTHTQTRQYVQRFFGAACVVDELRGPPASRPTLLTPPNLRCPAPRYQSTGVSGYNPHSPSGAAALLLPLLSRVPPWHAPVFTALQWLTDYDNWEQVEQVQKVGGWTGRLLWRACVCVNVLHGPPWHAPIHIHGAVARLTDYDNWEQIERVQQMGKCLLFCAFCHAPPHAHLQTLTHPQVGATTAAALGGARAWAPFAPHAQTLLRLPLDFSMARLPAAAAAAASLARLPRMAGLARLPTVGSTFVRLPLAARRCDAAPLLGGCLCLLDLPASHA